MEERPGIGAVLKIRSVTVSISGVRSSPGLRGGACKERFLS